MNSDSLQVLRLRFQGKLGPPVRLACPALRDIDSDGLTTRLTQARRGGGGGGGVGGGGGSRSECLRDMASLQKVLVPGRRRQVVARVAQGLRGNPSWSDPGGRRRWRSGPGRKLQRSGGLATGPWVSTCGASNDSPTEETAKQEACLPSPSPHLNI